MVIGFNTFVAEEKKPIKKLNEISILNDIGILCVNFGFQMSSTKPKKVMIKNKRKTKSLVTHRRSVKRNWMSDVLRKVSSINKLSEAIIGVV